MKDKEKIFDILGNAEDDTMKSLTDRCPEIDDAELERLLAVTERKYRMKKKDTDNERTEKDNNITMSENEVSGVEHCRRPVWLTPFLTAASVFLVAGVIMGSVIMLSRNGSNGGKVDPPAVTAITTDTTETATTAAGTSVTNTAETTKTTTAETTAETTVYTTEPYAAPAAENIFADDTLSRTAFDMYVKYEHTKLIFEGIGVTLDIDNYIKFTVDPKLNYNCYDFEKKKGEYIKDTVYYLPVIDDRFSSLDDLKSIARSVMTEESELYKDYERLLRSGFDDVEVGGRLDKEYIGEYIEYRGKLYLKADMGGKGYVPPVYSEKCPAIIADKTDTSFRVFVSEYYGNEDAFPELDECICAEVRFVLDPEFNDWRIDSVAFRDAPVYKEVYETANG